MSGWAVEHALTHSVSDSAALLDATSGPDLGDPYWAPTPPRQFLSKVGAEPGRLRIGSTEFAPDGLKGHPVCIDALHDAIALCTTLGHEVVEAELLGLTPETGAAIGTVFDAARA